MGSSCARSGLSKKHETDKLDILRSASPRVALTERWFKVWRETEAAGAQTLEKPAGTAPAFHAMIYAALPQVSLGKHARARKCPARR